MEGGRGNLALEELAQHPEGHNARVLLLGEPIPSYSLPVAPLPIDAASFIQTVSVMMSGPAQVEDWRVQEGHSLTAPPAEPPPESDPWQVPPPSERSNPALANALFGDMSTPPPVDLSSAPGAQGSVAQEEQQRAHEAVLAMDAAFEPSQPEVEAAPPAPAPELARAGARAGLGVHVCRHGACHGAGSARRHRRSGPHGSDGGHGGHGGLRLA